jgi:hypothetical protein
MTRTTNNRMLKTVVSVVLASLGPSTYLTHVRLGPSLAAASLNNRFEHPTRRRVETKAIVYLNGC